MNPDFARLRAFTLRQLIYSDTARARGIDNTPPPDAQAQLQRLALRLNEVQRLLGHPLRINSGYRCAALNEAVGGAPNSQHCRGEAVDFHCPLFGPPAAIARAIAQSAIDFDQCILEYGRWVHLSISAQPRRGLLSIYDADLGYITGLVAPDGSAIL